MIHRDLKPANIKLRLDGRVKVLDFGLAKALDPGGGRTGATDASVTRMSSSAQLSTALGTAAYMCPEQAQGRAVDQRCDVWAFGAVLYEMLTGRRAFQGRGIHDTLAAVLGADVDWNLLPADTPASIRALLMRCLDRDVTRRPQDLREARTVLELAPVPTISRRVVLSALGIGGAAAAAAWYFGTQSRRRGGAVRLPFILPRESSVLLPASRQALAFAPDGSQFVYVANNQLFRRSLSELAAHPIQGTEQFERVHQPVFSPDGGSLVFWAESDRTIKRMSLQGGTAQTICAVDNPFGMSWEGNALLLGQGRNGIWRVPAEGGTPQLLFQVNDGEEAHGPRLLPDGTVLYTIATGVEWLRWDDARLVVQVPGESTPTTVYRGGADARYLPDTEHVVFARGGTVLAAGFDVRRRRLTTAPVPVVEGVRRGNRDTGVAHFSISDTGRLIYVSGPFIGPEWGDQEIVIADRSGAVERVALPAGAYRGVRASPTGRHITFASDSGSQGTVYTCDLSGPIAMRPLEGPGSNRYPIFATSARGLRVVFQSNREGDEALYWQSADGTGPLFYVPRLGGFEVVRVITSPTFSFGPPMPVPRPFAPGAPRFRTLFDMMSDGRFVAMNPVGQSEDAATSGPGIQVVLDWFDELQEKVPT